MGYVRFLLGLTSSLLLVMSALVLVLLLMRHQTHQFCPISSSIYPPSWRIDFLLNRIAHSVQMGQSGGRAK